MTCGELARIFNRKRSAWAAPRNNQLSRRQLPPTSARRTTCATCAATTGVGGKHCFQFLVDLSLHRWMLSVLVWEKCVDLSEALGCIGHLPLRLSYPSAHDRASNLPVLANAKKPIKNPSNQQDGLRLPSTQSPIFPSPESMLIRAPYFFISASQQPGKPCLIGPEQRGPGLSTIAIRPRRFTLGRVFSWRAMRKLTLGGEQSPRTQPSGRDDQAVSIVVDFRARPGGNLGSARRYGTVSNALPHTQGHRHFRTSRKIPCGLKGRGFSGRH